MKKACVSIIALMLFMTQTILSYATETLLLGKVHSEEVTLIVEIEGETASVYDTAESAIMLMSVRENTVPEILMAQAEIKEEIAAKIDDVDMDGFAYTTVFNGFSIKAGTEDIETIKNIEGVKNVYISGVYPIEFHTNDIEETLEIMTEQAKIQGDTSYTGKGEAIAIIDSGFCVGHEMFSGAVNSPKYDMTKIDDRISSLSFGKSEDEASTVETDDVYKSDKIPFAYDYGDGDSDPHPYNLTGSSVAHGTHVAGIAGGNGGVYKGEAVNGVAPDAQLMLMKIYKTGYGISDEAVLAAINDAVALGACAINLSLGSVYVSGSCDTMYTDIIENARQKGTMVIASAGNSGMELWSGDNSRLPRTENIDYSTSGVPAVVSEAMSVGAAAPASTDTKIPRFSSFGVTENLELNPEITAPGDKILSSSGTNNKSDTNRYAIMSGTSMAAPYVTGVAAVLNEYLDAVEDDESVTVLEDRVNLIENLLMSTAKPVTKLTDGVDIPFSPRLQGAGLINIENSLATDAILLGDENRTKISLGEIGDDFTLSFSVKNIGDRPITFDNNSVIVTSDACTTISGENYITGTPKGMRINSSLAGDITVPAGETADILVSIELDEDETEAQSEIFPNGFFVDGFVYLKSSAGDNVDIGLPFMGFYGDWTSAPALDRTMYDEGGSLLFIKGSEFFRGTQLASVFENEEVPLGLNTIDGVDAYDKERIAISPDGDGAGDKLVVCIQPLRTLPARTSIVVKNSRGARVKEWGLASLSKFWSHSISLPSEHIDALQEGDYSITVTAKFNYDGARSENFTLPFTVDKTKPEICSAKVRDGKLVLTAQDSNYIKEIEVFYTDLSGVEKSKIVCVNGERGEMVSGEIDVSDIDLDTATARAMDYAMNYSESFSLEGSDRAVGIELGESISQTETETVIELAMDNKEASETSLFAIVAFYDENEKLIAVSAEQILLPSGESSYKCELLEDTRTANSIKVMLWDSGQHAEPFDPIRILEI